MAASVRLSCREPSTEAFGFSCFCCTASSWRKSRGPKQLKGEMTLPLPPPGGLGTPKCSEAHSRGQGRVCSRFRRKRLPSATCRNSPRKGAAPLPSLTSLFRAGPTTGPPGASGPESGWEAPECGPKLCPPTSGFVLQPLHGLQKALLLIQLAL